MGALSDVKFEKKAVGNMDTKIIELKVNYRLQECKTETKRVYLKSLNI